MRLLLSIIAAAIVLLPASRPSEAQIAEYDLADGYVVRNWTLRDGLPGNTVEDIVQTSDGYLWLATGNGLGRFDGVRFTNFTTSSSDVLPNNRLSSLYESGSGDLWILTAQSHLLRYAHGELTKPFPREGGRVSTVYKEAVAGRIAEDADTLWIGTDWGLSRVVNDRMEPYRPDEITNRVWRVFVDSNGTRWLGTFSGELLAIERSGNIRRYAADEGLPEERIHDILEDADGRIWVSTRIGLFVHTPDGSFEAFGMDGAPWQVNIKRMVMDVEGSIHFATNRHVTDRPGRFAGWYVKQGSRVNAFPAPPAEIPFGGEILTAADGSVWRFQGENLYRNTARVFSSPSPIRTIELDADQSVWVGTASHGLYRIRASNFQVISTPEGLPHPVVMSILEADDGAVWVGTQFGLGVIRDGNAKAFDLMKGYRGVEPTYFPRKGYSRVLSPGDEPWGLFQGRDGVLRIGTNYGPCHVEDDECVLDTYGDIPLDLYENVAAMLEDRTGRFWVGTKWGLILGTDGPSGTDWSRFSATRGLTNNWIRSILETRGGSVLFGTYGDGIMRFDGMSGFESLTTADGLSSDNITMLFEDGRGSVWVGTEDRGICRLYVREDVPLASSPFQCASVRDGLLDNTVYSILEDDQNRLWMNTNRGVSWLLTSDLEAFFAGQTTHLNPTGYTEQDGMRNRQGNGGVQPSAIRSDDGRLWFATHDGVAVVDPKDISARPAVLQPIIETVIVGGAATPVGSPISINAGTRGIQIDYTAPTFVRPEAVTFRYRLDGADEDWQMAGPDRRAVYTSLEPGEYTFRVAAGFDDAWTGPEAIIQIEQLPFFWQTRWFMAFGILVMLGAIQVAVRYGARKSEARNAALERMVADRTEEIQANQVRLEEQAQELVRMDELKSRFLANISHEFRTPLTLALGPLSDVEQGRHGELPEAARHEIGLAKRNTSRLLTLVNQLLDLSSLEAGGLILRPSKADLVSFVGQLVALFESLAVQRNIGLTFVPHADEIMLHFDKDKVEKVIVNLISNAFKFTASGGSITVGVESDSKRGGRVSVADTGVGIPPVHLPHVFDRFYQIDGSHTRRQEGNGIGLSLVKGLVELHGGTIDVSSEVGVGSTFTVWLPEGTAEDMVAVPEEDPGQSWSASPLAQFGDGATENDRESETVSETDPLVLIVEDNVDLRSYIRAHLQGQFCIVEANDGIQGVERAKELVPDLVISDVMMPGMNGYDLCRTLKADEATSHIPIILLTAKAGEDSLLQGLEEGADAYLVKPFNAVELRLRIRNLIESRRILQKRYSDRVLVLGPEETDLPAQETVFLEKVRHVVFSNMKNSDFGIDDLADDLSMSRRQLLRKLRALVDESPSDLVRRFRLEHAGQLLRSQTLTVKEVAQNTGFSSTSYFGRTFRQHFGVSPTEYSRLDPDEETA